MIIYGYDVILLRVHGGQRHRLGPGSCALSAVGQGRYMMVEEACVFDESPSRFTELGSADYGFLSHTLPWAAPETKVNDFA